MSMTLYEAIPALKVHAEGPDLSLVMVKPNTEVMCLEMPVGTAYSDFVLICLQTKPVEEALTGHMTMASNTHLLLN